VQGERFLLGLLRGGAAAPQICVAVHTEHSPRDLLRAFVAAELFRRALAAAKGEPAELEGAVAEV